jgi:RimJ/RimL family protein N-acetyltransferase
MLVTSKTNAERWALFNFLKKHGVELPRSEDFQAIGQLSLNTKDLIGVVGYSGFCGKTCVMNVAGEGNWLSRKLLWAAFDYPFNQQGVIQVFACVSETNARSLKLCHHLGFSQLAHIRDGWAEGIGMKILTMHKKECRWLAKLEWKHELQAA